MWDFPNLDNALCTMHIFLDSGKYHHLSQYISRRTTSRIHPKCSVTLGQCSPSVCSSLQKLCWSQRRGSRRRARSSFAPSQTSSFFDNHSLTLRAEPGFLATFKYDQLGFCSQGRYLCKITDKQDTWVRKTVKNPFEKRGCEAGCGDVHGAEVGARLDSLRIGAHLNSAQTNPDQESLNAN